MLDRVLNSGLDIGIETPFLLLILVGLEAVLSADNAVALAAIAQGIENPKDQRRALNVGLVLAYLLRITLILTATWVIQFWQFDLLGGAYLIWLTYNYFRSSSSEEDGQRYFHFVSLWQAVPMIAVTDLAFSLDSVTAAIAIVDNTWLVIAGGTIGVITLRFLAGLFLRWLEIYSHLEDAAFITVGFVGLRLIAKVINPVLIPPEWVTMVVVLCMFIWGFSEKKQPSSSVDQMKEATETVKIREKQKQN